MRHVAAVAVAGVIWLINRKRHASQRIEESNVPPTPPNAPTVPPTQQSRNIAASSAGATPPVNSALPAPAVSAPPSKSIVSAVLQWIFLILLGAALSLTAAKGAWDVFAVLVTAAVVQLGGQLARWSDNTVRRGSNGATRGTQRGAAAGRPNDPSVAPGPARPVVCRPDPRLGGVWVKDPSRSDSMEPVMDAMRLNGLVRRAVGLVRGLELDGATLQTGRFNMAVFSVIPILKIRESYLLDGTVGHFKRRDLRKGQHAASVAVQPDGSVVLSISWGEPLAGSGTDHFAVLPAPPATAVNVAASGLQSQLAADPGDLLVVVSTLRIASGAAAGAIGTEAAPGSTNGGGGGAGGVTMNRYRTVYVRAGGPRGGLNAQNDQLQG